MVESIDGLIARGRKHLNQTFGALMKERFASCSGCHHDRYGDSSPPFCRKGLPSLSSVQNCKVVWIYVSTAFSPSEFSRRK